MSWLNSFELLCYLIVIISLVSFVKQKDYRSLFAFGTAALVGLTLELLAVSFSGKYYYNNGFLIVLGIKPHQFPVFGGLMWGVLTAYAIKIAQKFRFNKIITSLFAGILIVTMDLFLDVVAIRLDGGFWIWVGEPLNISINSRAFMGVTWVNFLGYMIMTPGVAYLTLKTQELVNVADLKKQTLHMLLNCLGGIIIAGIGNFLNLLINNATNSMFSFIAFPLIWIVMVVIIGQRAICAKLKLSKTKDWDWPMAVFWTAIYIYCLAAILYLNIQCDYLWFFLSGILFMIITAFFCFAEPIKGSEVVA